MSDTMLNEQWLELLSAGFTMIGKMRFGFDAGLLVPEHLFKEAENAGWEHTHFGIRARTDEQPEQWVTYSKMVVALTKSIELTGVSVCVLDENGLWVEVIDDDLASIEAWKAGQDE